VIGFEDHRSTAAITTERDVVGSTERDDLLVLLDVSDSVELTLVVTLRLVGQEHDCVQLGETRIDESIFKDLESLVIGFFT
jgi:hypothetical protein